jgi:Xaa-Pro aminopeptidase
MPANTVAVFLVIQLETEPTMWIMFHQDPDFYYLTGYKEPNCVLVLFSSDQTAKDGKI